MDSKKCSRCNQILPVASFHKDKTTPTGLKSACKECVKTMSDNLKEKRKTESGIIQGDGQTCVICNETKEIKLFYKTKNGYTSTCKKCFMQQAKNNRKLLKNTISNRVNNLSKVTSEQLIAELKQRGYKGELTIQVIERIAL